jgi:hypothetical protein
MDPTGDLAVGARGSIYQAPDSVIKLSGKDGSILWRKGIAAAGQTSLVLGLAADASGDFLAVSTVFKPLHTPSLAALKLSGRNGSEIWRYESDESDANQVTLNSAGDVILAGGTLLGKTFLTKLDGISGGLQWTTAPGTLLTTAVRSIATTRKGDVLLGGTIGRDFIVEKVSGQDGSELWQQSLRGACFDDTIPCHGRANSVATDPAGDAFGAGGAAPDPASDRRAFAVVKFSGETGEMLWSRFLNETNPTSNDLAQAMAITPHGDVVASGWVGNLITGVDAVIVKLDGRTGADYKPSRLRMLDALLSELRVLHLPPGIHSSLEAKLIAARRTLEKSPSGGASANALTEFVHEVHAQSGKKIDAADSARLVAAAQEIKDVLTAAP